jgi:hypothetical protein
VTVCSASAGTTCASIYVTVTSALSTIILSQNTVSLVPGEKILISIIGGDAKTTIYSNSNPSVVTTFLNTSGNGVVLTGGTTSGTAVITICPTDTYSSKCSALLVTVKEAATNATIILPTSSSCIKLLRADGDSKVYLIKDGTKQRIKTEAEFNTAGYHWSDVMVTTSASIAAYPDAAITATPATTPAVCPKLLRADGDNKVYLIKDGTKQWIKTEAEFNTAGYHWSDVILTTNANMASYPDVLISPVVKVKVVKTPTLRVRQLNTTKSNVLGSVNENEIFTVLQENNGWYKIKTSTGITGWISGAYAVKL